jgi:hypothetical protein
LERDERNLGLLSILTVATALGVDAGTFLAGLWRLPCLD